MGSNFGKKSVELFAPGVDIYSSVPDNEYQVNSGTSMAAPVVTGVAALVWSYFPDLTANELKVILLKSVEKRKKMEVRCPEYYEKGDKTLVKFKNLCSSGGLVNAYNAMKLATKKQ